MRSDAALGRERQALHAGVRQLEHEVGRQVVEAQRGHRDLVVHRRPGRPRCLRSRGGRRPRWTRGRCLLVTDAHLARARHDLGAREAAHGQVVVAGPAEAAHAGAAARDLHHELHGHLGVRREDGRLRHRHLARPSALAHDRARARRRPHGAVVVVANLVPRRDVEAVLRLKRLDALARVGGAHQRIQQPRAPAPRPRPPRSRPRRARAAPGSGRARPRPSGRSGRPARGPRARSGMPAMRIILRTWM